MPLKSRASRQFAKEMLLWYYDHTMKKRILSCFAVLMLTASLLSGCAQETQEASPTAAPSPTPDPHAGMVEVTDGAGGLMWVDEVENLEVFPMDRALFSVEDGRAAYAGEDYDLRLGVDVSDHQGEIDWQAVADAGVEFAILRCGWRGYSAGGLNEDATFRQNIEGAQAAGLDVGVYFFSQAISMAEAAEEALYTLKLLEGYELQLPVFFDWEKIGTDAARTDDVPGETVTAACLEYCRLIQSEGYDAGVYMYLNLAYYTYDLEQFAGMTIWMGDPGSAPEFYYDHDYWQYTFTGSVPGIEGEVDMDVLYRPTQPEIVIVPEEALG